MRERASHQQVWPRPSMPLTQADAGLNPFISLFRLVLFTSEPAYPVIKSGYKQRRRNAAVLEVTRCSEYTWGDRAIQNIPDVASPWYCFCGHRVIHSTWRLACIDYQPLTWSGGGVKIVVLRATRAVDLLIRQVTIRLVINGHIMSTAG